MAKVVHFEIPIDDAGRALAFYRNAFGWEIAGFGDEQYWLARAGTDEEPGANGALISRGAVHQSPVLIVGVSDLDAALAAVRAAGGQEVLGKQRIPGVGWSAYVLDSEGNTIGLFEAQSDGTPGH